MTPILMTFEITEKIELKPNADGTPNCRLTLNPAPAQPGAIVPYQAPLILPLTTDDDILTYKPGQIVNAQLTLSAPVAPSA